MITCTFEDGDPAMLRHVVLHAIVERDGQLLLEKRAGDLLESGKWALPGGFLDRDETAAEGILRELTEETGWVGEVTALFRINSNPHRPREDRQNVAFEFIIKPLEHVVVTNTGETSKVEWVDIAKLHPLETFAFDHGETIRQYLAYRKKPFALPLLV